MTIKTSSHVQSSITQDITLHLLQLFQKDKVPTRSLALLVKGTVLWLRSSHVIREL